MVPIGLIAVPMSTGPLPELQFHAEDQRAFARSLGNELVRLGVLKSVAGYEQEGLDPKIRILFAQTFHNPNHQEYTLDVAMEIVGGQEPFLKQYRVVSSEKDSMLEKWNTNAYQGKAKAARLLMERLIPDIEAYVASMGR